MRVSALLASLLLGAAPAVQAQGAAPVAAPVCDATPREVTLRLMTRRGVAVSDAGLEVRRVQRRTLVRESRAFGDGRYLVVRDGSLPDLRPGGEPFDVTFRLHDRLKRVRLIIGLDARRCHVTLKGGRTTVIL